MYHTKRSLVQPRSSFAPLARLTAEKFTRRKPGMAKPQSQKEEFGSHSR
jgi:hypothetical protein